MLQFSTDKIKAGLCCFERPGPRGHFLAEIQIHCSTFPSNAEKDSPLVPFCGWLGKLFKTSAPIWTIFASLLEHTLDGYLLHGKVEPAVANSETKIVLIAAESFKIFPRRLEKGMNGLSFFALEGKIEQWIQILTSKRPRSSGLSK